MSPVLFYTAGFWKLKTNVPCSLGNKKVKGSIRGVHLGDRGHTHSVGCSCGFHSFIIWCSSDFKVQSNLFWSHRRTRMHTEANAINQLCFSAPFAVKSIVCCISSWKSITTIMTLADSRLLHNCAFRTVEHQSTHHTAAVNKKKWCCYSQWFWSRAEPDIRSVWNNTESKDHCVLLWACVSPQIPYGKPPLWP